MKWSCCCFLRIGPLTTHSDHAEQHKVVKLVEVLDFRLFLFSFSSSDPLQSLIGIIGCCFLGLECQRERKEE